jgi:hypothetical protein
MTRLSIPFLLALALCVNACERHSASSLPSHGAHAAAAGEHAAAPHADADSKKEASRKEAVGGPAPKFFEQQPGK